MNRKTSRPPTESSDRLAQVVLRKASWVRAALSPWVQRSLRREGAAGPGVAAIRQQPVAFSVQHTRSWMNRVQRQAEGGRVW
ncbi:MAG TPA: hypothetical protein ENJ31_01975, partial [Anaerolineae bacterium]|nr:hypothetical protein [Anaerolineae bacterium]